MALEFYSTTDLCPTLTQEIMDFLDSQDTSHLFQFPQWNVSGAKCALLRKEGSIQWFCAFGVHTPLGASLPWMRAIIANRGPVCDDRQLWHSTTAEFIEHLRRERVTYFDAIPDWAQTLGGDDEKSFGNSKWQRLGKERSSLRLDLRKSEDEIFAAFRKNSRYEVRRAERLGISVSPASRESEIEEFLALHGRLAARKGFRTEPRNELHVAIRWLVDADSRGALLLARSEHVVYGGAVIGRCGKRCWYVWGASEKHEHFNVGHILQWKALLWAKSHNCTEYDFGGYTPDATSGPAWFKAGFGGMVVHFVPPHRRVIREGYYRAFSLALKMKELSKRSSATLWASKAWSPKLALTKLVEE
jgi:hypothetical protein